MFCIQNVIHRDKRGTSKIKTDSFSADHSGKKLQITHLIIWLQVLAVGLIFMREYDHYLNLLYIRKANHHAHHAKVSFILDGWTSKVGSRAPYLDYDIFEQSKMKFF